LVEGEPILRDTYLGSLLFVYRAKGPSRLFAFAPAKRAMQALRKTGMIFMVVRRRRDCGSGRRDVGGWKMLSFEFLKAHRAPDLLLLQENADWLTASTRQHLIAVQ